VLVISAIFQQTINNVQRQCFETTTKVSDELENHFPIQDVMDVLKFVYPQYWLKPSSEQTSLVHMAILKDFCSQPKKLGSSQTWIMVVLDVNVLDLEFSFFKITMMSNVQWAMD